MLHARIARFDVMATVALFKKTFRELNKALSSSAFGVHVKPSPAGEFVSTHGHANRDSSDLESSCAVATRDARCNRAAGWWRRKTRSITRDARRKLLHLLRMSVIQSSSMPQNPNGDLIRLNMCVLCWPVMEFDRCSTEAC